jgi:(R)-2-hydroxyacyl-CoA dehydratese activating ATPase
VNYAGLDVGSNTIKLVTLQNGVTTSAMKGTGVNPLKRCQELVLGLDLERLVVTGYGRHLVAPVLGGTVVTEIKAFAVGARAVFSGCGTIIDIGGQDSKVIQLNQAGRIQKFEMNDRCAAGTGKFLEIMARTLEVKIEDLADLALSATRKVNINSLCTVFAESEVVSLIARGEEPSAIALALHEAIAIRVATMLERVGVKERVVFAGGGSLNRCLVRLLEEKLRVPLLVPASAQMVGALGAALLAEKQEIAENNI